MKRDIHKQLQALGFPTERLALEHAMILEDVIEMFDTSTHELDPLVPRDLRGG